MKKIMQSLLLLIPLFSISQESLRGVIETTNSQKEHIGLPGVSVHWLNTSVGVTTNKKGRFQIPYTPKNKKLIISYIGYKTDTIDIKNTQELQLLLEENISLDEVQVHNKKKATSISFLTATNSIKISENELLKAACCNLSESFETNPSIDVNYSNALSGNKEIKMLGLTSPYLLITQENIPSVRGASQAYGMNFIPGTWIKSIQLTKGIGSVVNGFESISGQINAELRKPKTDHPFFINLFSSMSGRMEANTYMNQKISENWSTGLYLHGNKRKTKIDHNKDGFLDAPLAEQINFMNRWQYINPTSGWVSFIDVKYLTDDKQLGDVSFKPKKDKSTQFEEEDTYGAEVNTKRFEAATKLGYVFKDKPYQNFGIQTAFSTHDQNAYFGKNTYNIKHESVYINTVFQSIIESTQHKFKTGLNFSYDRYNELIDTYYDYTYSGNSSERSFGSFFEYTYDNLDNFTLVAGVRVDAHNLIGTFVTPRLHLRYEPWEQGVLKAAVGSGKRVSHIFAENQKIFASSRKISFLNDESVDDLKPESAWNYGLTYLHHFEILENQGTVALDFYRTHFSNQIIVDYETPEKVSFYNLSGESIANSFQIETAFEWIQNFEIRLAYKYLDVKEAYQDRVRQKPLQPKHRYFANFAYETPQNQQQAFWKFDATYNWIGSQRIPNTHGELPLNSKGYNLVNMQVSHIFSPNFEIYLGGENLTGKTQKTTILGADTPFGTNFDTTVIYAPIVGRTFYGGIRYKI